MGISEERRRGRAVGRGHGVGRLRAAEAVGRPRVPGRPRVVGRGPAVGRARVGRAAALLAGAAIAVLALLPGTAAAFSYPPTASPAVPTAEGFELKGTVYDYGGTTTWHFEYGTTTAYGTSVPTPDADASGGLYTSVSQQVTGLAPGATYHYRLVSTNSVEGTLTSADQTFSTASSAPPTGTAPGGGSAGSGTGTGTGLYPGESNAPGSATVGGSGRKRVAKAVHSRGKTLLATTKGRTLYSLSAERHGKFICTASSGCTSIWTPLTVASGVVPKGPVKLGTVHRPEGAIQVTYRGHPLYTFGSDRKPGQTKGEGMKDVGTWHATVLRTKRGR